MTHRRGFTLVELLVVIAIIGILIGLLLPAVQMAREAGRRTTCRNNLRQVGLALHAYHDVRGTLPAGYTYRADPTGNTLGFGWATLSLPHIEQQSLYGEFDFRVGLRMAANETPRMRHLACYLCPSDPDSATGFVEMGDEQYAMGSYVANFGPGDMDENQEDRRGVFSRNSATRLTEIVDGLSNTFFTGERINGPFRGGSHGVHVFYETTWAGAVREITEPTDDHGHMVLFQSSHAPNALDSDDRDVSAPHPQGAHFLLGDGSVHMISELIDLKVYRALSTRDGGEPTAGVP